MGPGPPEAACAAAGGTTRWGSRLFDVAGLVAAGYDDAHRPDVPLIVQTEAAAVEVSFDDGATWAPATVWRGQDGEYAAVVDHPDAAGFVSLRATASDGRGNAVEQTTIRAYELAAAPGPALDLGAPQEDRRSGTGPRKGRRRLAMFIQVIEGKVRDAEALHERINLWERDLMPGAIGYLGSTGGCTESGDCILVARFTDADAARRNSQRPEQGAWWAETEKLFDGPVTFHDTTDVYVMGHDEQMDDAHFVQVMEGHVSDRARADALNDEAAPLLAEERPDLIGSVTAFHGHGDYTEVAYFTSEADAREGERKQMSPEMADRFAQFQDLWKVDRYLDITDPWLNTAGGGRY